MEYLSPSDNRLPKIHRAKAGWCRLSLLISLVLSLVVNLAYAEATPAPSPATDVTDDDLQKILESRHEVLEKARETRLAREKQEAVEQANEYLLQLEKHNGSWPSQTVDHMADTLRAYPDEGVPMMVDLLKHPAPKVRAAAVRALGAYGVDALRAVPNLLAALDNLDKDVAPAAALALSEIAPDDPQVIAALTKALSGTDDFLLENAANAMGTIGLPARSATPELLKLLKHPKLEVQYSAFTALGKVSGQQTRLTLDKVRKYLNEAASSPPQESLDDALVVNASAAFLVLPAADGNKYGISANVLYIGESRSEPYLKLAAINALQTLGPGSAAEIVRYLLQCMVDERLPPQIRAAGRKAVGSIHPGDYPAVGPLIEGLNSPSQEVRLASASAIGNIGPAASEAAPHLLAQLKRVYPSRAGGESAYNYLDAFRDVYVRPPGSDRLDSETYGRDIVQLMGLMQSKAKGDNTVAQNVDVKLLLLLAEVGIPRDPKVRREISQFVESGLRSREISDFVAAIRLAGALGPEGTRFVPQLLRAREHRAMIYILTYDLAPGYNWLLEPAILSQRSLRTWFYRPGDKPGTSVWLESLRSLGQIGAGAKAALPELRRIAALRDDEYWSFFRPEAQQAVREIEADLAAHDSGEKPPIP